MHYLLYPFHIKLNPYQTALLEVETYVTANLPKSTTWRRSVPVYSA